MQSARSNGTKVEGRKELESDSAGTTGPIPEETINHGDPLAGSTGVADPANLVPSPTK